MTTPAMDNTTPLTIGQAAAQAGVSAKMVRHYETLGLLPPVARTEAGYRLYTAREVHALRFIRRARDLGFGMAEISRLLALWHDQSRASADVRKIAQSHVAHMDRRLLELQAMRDTLQHLVTCCRGDGRPDCPILDDLDLAPANKAAASSQAGQKPQPFKGLRAKRRSG